MHILIFLLPGILLVLLKPFNKKGFTELLISISGSSLSGFILIPWLIRPLGISLQGFAYLIFIASLLLLILNFKKLDLKSFALDKNEGIILAAFILILLLRLVPLALQPVPDGIEMSRQSYAARLICENDGLPGSFLFPTGLASITALISLLSDFQIYRSSLIISCVSYALLTFGLYVMLLKLYDRKTAAFSAFAATFLSRSPQWLFSKGDNSSVLALFLFLIFLSLGLEIYKKYSHQTAMFLFFPLFAAIVTDLTFLISPASFAVVYAFIFAVIMNRYGQYLKGLMPIIILMGLVFYGTLYIRSSFIACPVTQADINALKWVDMNVNKKAVFLANNSDAGIWIPAVTGRSITKASQNDKSKPGYIYLGSKPVGNADLKREDLEKKPWKFRRIYSKDGAQVWKIL